LVGQREGHPACKTVRVMGVLVVTIWIRASDSEFLFIEMGMLKFYD